MCALVAVAGLPATARGESPTLPAASPTIAATPVVGGGDAPVGKWPDAAAILFGNTFGCSGTLIADTVALTAGHCDDSSLQRILVGASSLARTSEGEFVSVTRRVQLTEADITVLVLASPSRFPPRPIASGWAHFDIKNGAPVAIVGFGAIDRNASQTTPDLQEAMSTITDFDCSTKSGCSTNELGAGGNGIDSCNGDSGGPLYLITDYGAFLVGVTSRGYDDARDPCGEGGIYGRPDLVVAQIEQAAGKPIAKGPAPTAAPITAPVGGAGETTIAANDPVAATHTFAIAAQPIHGTAAVRSDGRVRVCVAAGAPPGSTDSLIVSVTDPAAPARTLMTPVALTITSDSVTGDCDPMAFDGEDSGGCCDSRREPTSALATACIVAVAMLRRRRRRHILPGDARDVAEVHRV